MNERVPDSHGLPLRAMVMVLLFLGVIFALVGFNALGNDKAGSSESTASSPATAAQSSTSSKPPPPPKPDVRVYNTTSVAGLAQGTADQVTEAGWKVTEVSNLAMPEVNVTTVFFGEAPGEEAAAHEIAKLLGLQAAPRPPELADEPPGIVIAVAI